jgi:protein-tyrosine phosphatase
MIDLHCHLLAGVDDGPTTLQESVELCRIAVADGINHAVVTPHLHPGRWENTRGSIARHCDRLQERLVGLGIPLRLGFAAEVRLTDQLIRQIENDEIPFYGEVDGFQIMLLEFPHSQLIPGSDQLVRWLLEHKIRPLIAHPERNRQVLRDVAQLEVFVEAGCWLQLTAGSIIGNFGERARAVALYLLQTGAVTVLASDGHNTRARPPVMRQAFDEISEHHGREMALRLMLDNPAAIVAAQFAG